MGSTIAFKQQKRNVCKISGGFFDAIMHSQLLYIKNVEILWSITIVDDKISMMIDLQNFVG